MEVGLLTSFLGGTLALMSPCSALLLPAFFASTVGSGLRLLTHGAVFYMGLLVTLVPFGLGIGALGSLVVSERGLIVAVTSFGLIALGTAQACGFGFDMSRAVPGVRRMQQGSTRRGGYARTVLLGASSGVAGFCAGPILGTILTLAFAQGSPWSAGGLLAVYGAGMVVPLVALAAIWQRLGPRGQRQLRGRQFELLGRTFHTTSLLTGMSIVTIGLLFWTTNGFVGTPAVVPTDVQLWLQTRASTLASPAFDIAAIVTVTAVALAWTRRSRRRRPHPEQQTPTTLG